MYIKKIAIYESYPLGKLTERVTLLRVLTSLLTVKRS